MPFSCACARASAAPHPGSRISCQGVASTPPCSRSSRRACLPPTSGSTRRRSSCRTCTARSSAPSLRTRALESALADALLAILKPVERPLAVDRSKKPYVILVVGVNGSGKTTTIGKLARRLKDQGLSVMVAAGDTFRAAAVEQLAVWAERNGVPIVEQGTGADE